MTRGKQTCKILKEIRRQIAEANDIEFITSECRYKGDCLGTCPKCEAEVRYLEQQLRSRQLAGKLVNLAGISAGALAMLAPQTVQAQTVDTSLPMGDVAVHAPVDTIIVRGTVYGEYTAEDGTVAKDLLIGATVVNLNRQNGTTTDIDGKFEIKACIGDSIKMSFVGYNSQTVVVNGNEPLNITLNDKGLTLQGEAVVLRGAYSASVTSIEMEKQNLHTDLYIIGEDKKPISYEDVEIEKMYIEDGEEYWDYIDEMWIEEENVSRLFWNRDWNLQDDDGKPLKEVTLRITAEGYEKPVTIKLRYPKRNTKKTIRFKYEKK